MTAFDRTDAARRGFLAQAALGGLAAGAGALGGSPASAAARPLDLTDRSQRLRAYLMMRGALDDRLVIGCLSGRYYGVVDNEVKPLYGVFGATFARFRPAPGGGYEGVTYEVPFFTDPQTGAVLDHWRNPYTGEDVAVPQTAMPPARIAIDANLKLTLPQAVPGLALDHRVLPAEVIGDDLWMTEETLSAFQGPGMDKPVRYSELVTLHSRTADLLRPGAQRAPCQTAYTSIVSWRPWLKMGDRPGHLIGNGVGLYGVTLDELPAGWRAGAEARRPGVLKDPGAPLAALWAARP